MAHWQDYTPSSARRVNTRIAFGYCDRPCITYERVAASTRRVTGRGEGKTVRHERGSRVPCICLPLLEVTCSPRSLSPCFDVVERRRSPSEFEAAFAVAGFSVRTMAAERMVQLTATRD
jgi:hypothetical protein